jgi:hypothetical protein
MYETIIIIMHIIRILNDIYIQPLPMMNPLSITTVHAIQQNLPVHNSLTKVFLIKASTTWEQYLLILTEFSLNKVHKFFDTINVFIGKQSAMHPTSIHPIKHCKKNIWTSVHSRKKNKI